MGISEKQLLQDPCISVIVGASILSDMMKSTVIAGRPLALIMPGRHRNDRI